MVRLRERTLKEPEHASTLVNEEIEIGDADNESEYDEMSSGQGGSEKSDRRDSDDMFIFKPPKSTAMSQQAVTPSSTSGAVKRRKTTSAAPPDEADASALLFEKLCSDEMPKNQVYALVDNFQADYRQSSVILLNFILEASSFRFDDPDYDVSDADLNTDAIVDLVKKFDVLARKTDNPDGYALGQRTKSAKTLETNMHSFWKSFVAYCLEDADENMPWFVQLFDTLLRSMIVFSRCHHRGVRHTSSFCIGAFTEGVVSHCKKLNSSMATIVRQLDSSSRPPSTRKSSSRASIAKSSKNLNPVRSESLEKDKEQIASMVGKLENALAEIVSSFVDRRYRDISPSIRALIVSHVGGNWIPEYPSFFLTDSHMKYLGWLLYDKSPVVRQADIVALHSILQSPLCLPGCDLFVRRFRKRLIEMCQDSNARVASVAIDVCSLLLNAGLVEYEDVSFVLELVCDESEVIFSSVENFVTSYLEETMNIATVTSTTTSEMSEGAETALYQAQIVSFLSVVPPGDIELLHPLVRVLFRRFAFFGEWEAMISLLTPTTDQRVEGKEETLLMILLLSISLTLDLRCPSRFDADLTDFGFESSDILRRKHDELLAGWAETISEEPESVSRVREEISAALLGIEVYPSASKTTTHAAAICSLLLQHSSSKQTILLSVLSLVLPIDWRVTQPSVCDAVVSSLIRLLSTPEPRPEPIIDSVCRCLRSIGWGISHPGESRVRGLISSMTRSMWRKVNSIPSPHEVSPVFLNELLPLSIISRHCDISSLRVEQFCFDIIDDLLATCAADGTELDKSWEDLLASILELLGNSLVWGSLNIGVEDSSTEKSTTVRKTRTAKTKERSSRRRKSTKTAATRRRRSKQQLEEDEMEIDVDKDIGNVCDDDFEATVLTNRDELLDRIERIFNEMILDRTNVRIEFVETILDVFNNIVLLQSLPASGAEKVYLLVTTYLKNVARSSQKGMTPHRRKHVRNVAVAISRVLVTSSASSKDGSVSVGLDRDVIQDEALRALLLSFMQWEPTSLSTDAAALLHSVSRALYGDQWPILLDDVMTMLEGIRISSGSKSTRVLSIESKLVEFPYEMKPIMENGGSHPSLLDDDIELMSANDNGVVVDVDNVISPVDMMLN